MGPAKTSHSLYNLYRRDGLNDIFSDVLAGVKGGVAAVKAAGNGPALPNINLPSVSGVSLPNLSVPAWLSTFVSGGVKAGQAAANTTAPAVNIATGGAARPVALPKSPVNYVAWGAALLAAGVAWRVTRGRR